MTEFLNETYENGSSGNPLTPANTIFTTVWGTQTPTFTTTAYQGSLAGSYAVSASSAGSDVVFAAKSQVWLTGRIRLNALPAAYTGIINWWNGATKVGDIRCSATGQLQLRDNATQVALSNALSTGAWHRFALFVDPGTASTGHRLKLYEGANVDGLTADQNISGNATSSAQTQLTEFRFGVINSTTMTVVFDDLHFDDADEWFPAAAAPGVADFVMSIAAPANTVARSGWVYTLDATGSTGATTLVWDGAGRGTITESPTGVFSITDPNDGDAPLALVLTAAGVNGGDDDVVNLSIPRGGASTRPRVLTKKPGGLWPDPSSWG